MKGSITVNGMHRLMVPARLPSFSSKPITTTTSLGGTIWTICGFDSISARVKSIFFTLSHASPSAVMPRLRIFWINRVSISVSGRFGMKTSSLEPPNRRSMIG